MSKCPACGKSITERYKYFDFPLTDPEKKRIAKASVRKDAIDHINKLYDEMTQFKYNTYGINPKWYKEQNIPYKRQVMYSKQFLNEKLEKMDKEIDFILRNARANDSWKVRDYIQNTIKESEPDRKKLESAIKREDRVVVDATWKKMDLRYTKMAEFVGKNI